MVTDGENESISRRPTLDEVKKAVFQLKGSSSSGPDGLSGIFPIVLGSGETRYAPGGDNFYSRGHSSQVFHSY